MNCHKLLGAKIQELPLMNFKDNYSVETQEENRLMRQREGLFPLYNNEKPYI